MRLTEQSTQQAQQVSDITPAKERVDLAESQTIGWRYRLPELTDDEDDRAIVTAVEVQEQLNAFKEVTRRKIPTSESMSAPKRKKGRSFMISFIWASAPGGGALAADGALISGCPLGFGVEVAGKASEEAAGTTSEDSGEGWVESGKEAGKEAASFTRGPFKATSSGSEPSQPPSPVDPVERMAMPPPLVPQEWCSASASFPRLHSHPLAAKAQLH